MTSAVLATDRTERVRLFMKAQAIVIGIYGVAFVLFPAFSTETIFGWDGVDYTWVRAVGVPLLAIAWLEWLAAPDIDQHLGLVWPFVSVPALYVLVFLYERIADVYAGPDSWWWTNFVVVTIFTVAGVWARLTATTETPAG